MFSSNIDVRIREYWFNIATKRRTRNIHKTEIWRELAALNGLQFALVYAIDPFR